MSSVFSSAFFFVLTLGVLITFHEFGHFWVARRMGVKVLRFSVGFGKPLWSVTRGPDRTEYVVAALPFGGYVRMLDEREGEVAEHEVHRAFNRQPLASRAAIVAAGPVFNFALAVLLYWLVFMWGVAGLKPIVGTVYPDSIASAAGLESGDEITKVGDKPTPSWSTAILSLLDKALVEDEVMLTVTSADGVESEHVMNVATLAGDLDQTNLMELLGVEPVKLKIPPVIGQLEAGGPAARGGLETGDLVVGVDGEPVDDWGQWVEMIRAKPDQDIRVEVLRGGVTQFLVLHPERISSRQGDYGRIGAGVKQEDGVYDEYSVVERYGPLASLTQSITKCWDVTVLTLRMLYKMIVGEVSVTNLSGPLSIAQYAGGSASIGVVPFLSFLALVSISLGVLNLLPIPVLDGGHLLYYLAEWVKGSPVSATTELLGQKIGVAVILVLMVFAFYNDLMRIFG